MENHILTALEVYHWPFSKQRLGRSNDGGYIVCDIPGVRYNLFLTGGISWDISFEEDFLRHHPDVLSYAFDHSIEKLPETIRGIDTVHSKSVNFIKKKIGKNETDNETNLINFLNNHKNIFLKLDVEGGEYNLWEALTDVHLANVAQMVIEIHPTNLSNLEKFLSKHNKTHVLFHAHANNVIYDSYELQEIKIPKLLELTYVNRDLLNFSLEKNTTPLPSEIDMRNISKKEEIQLNYYPFTS